uniref:beta-galactoside alpha-(2,6)-sialyltransferase n=1 Tax=Tetraselmis sp. GSL018 TaxID=582737 RepID=A0A061S202_9CHLO
MNRRSFEPQHVGFLALLAAVAVLEIFYEFVGFQFNVMPRGPAVLSQQETVIEKLRGELGSQHRHPLLSKYLLSDLPFPRLNVSSRVLHGTLTADQARELELNPTEAEELNQILPEQDFRHQYGSCALVGNSASLLQYQFGNEIDGHDVVMRFNDAPTRGFEESVGRRCTFRAVTYEHVRLLMGTSRGGAADKERHKDKGALKAGARTVLILPGTPVRFYTEMRRKFPENIIMFMAPEVGRSSRALYQSVVDRLRLLGEPEASRSSQNPTGLEAALFLMQVCKTVSLYGFQPVVPPHASSMPSVMYYDKAMTSTDVTATAMSFFFWRVVNMEALVRLRC